MLYGWHSLSLSLFLALSLSHSLSLSLTLSCSLLLSLPCSLSLVSLSGLCQSTLRNTNEGISRLVFRMCLIKQILITRLSFAWMKTLLCR